MEQAKRRAKAGVEGGAAKPVSDAKPKSSKSGGDGKQKDMVKEPQPKPTKDKKPKKLDKAIDPAKALQSRKSAAYHKAKKDALQSGKPEEAKALANKGAWMCWLALSFLWSIMEMVLLRATKFHCFLNA